VARIYKGADMTGYESKKAMAQDKLAQPAQESVREALKLALNVLEDLPGFRADIDDAITAIKEALAQPAQEPVAWGVFEGNLHDMFFTEAEAVEMAQLKGTHAEVKPLYTKEKNNG